MEIEIGATVRISTDGIEDKLLAVAKAHKAYCLAICDLENAVYRAQTKITLPDKQD